MTFTSNTRGTFTETERPFLAQNKICKSVAEWHSCNIAVLCEVFHDFKMKKKKKPCSHKPFSHNFTVWQQNYL